MSPSMKDQAVRVARSACSGGYEKFGDMADHVRRHFDARYGQAWHCIVGPGLGSSVTPNHREYIDFNLGQIKVVLFKTQPSQRNGN